MASVGDKSCSNIAAVSQVEPAAMLQTGQQKDENYYFCQYRCIPFAHNVHVHVHCTFVLGHLLSYFN